MRNKILRLAFVAGLFILPVFRFLARQWVFYRLMPLKLILGAFLRVLGLFLCYALYVFYPIYNFVSTKYLTFPAAVVMICKIKMLSRSQGLRDPVGALCL